MVASPFGFENLSISVRSYERSVITELLIMVMGKSFDHRNHRHLSDTVCVYASPTDGGLFAPKIPKSK